MAIRKNESGEQRQKRIRRERHRPEQSRGYDEAVRGGPAPTEPASRRVEGGSLANDRPDRMVPVSGEESQLQNTTEDVDERESRRAREQVREHDQSGSRQSTREP
jgi:hypothetical protein